VLYRARMAFLVAVVVGAIVLVTEFPLAGLVHARATANATAAELTRMRNENRALSIQVHQLRLGSTIQQIAHQEYGLVEPGQRSVVIMPGGGAGGSASVGGRGPTGASAPLGSTTIPKSDIVPSDSSLSNGVLGGGTTAGAGGSFWQRLLNRLEFWKASV
jgi:hypothetical protein